MSESTVLSSTAEGVVTLTLNRPQRLNSLNVEMHQALRSALATARGFEGLRVLVLRGAGRAFCGGQDLEERRRVPGVAPADLGESIRTNYAPLIQTIGDFPVPVVAAVQGVAAGSGANLALACDLVVAARSASFIQPFTRIGLMPDAAGGWRLPRMIGMARARGLTLLSETLSAEKAAEWGLIWQCVDDDALDAAVASVVARLSGAAPLALAATRSALNAGAHMSLDEYLQVEQKMQRELGYTQDYVEGLTAFFEKRAPQFNGNRPRFADRSGVAFDE